MLSTFVDSTIPKLQSTRSNEKNIKNTLLVYHFVRMERLFVFCSIVVQEILWKVIRSFIQLLLEIEFFSRIVLFYIFIRFEIFYLVIVLIVNFFTMIWIILLHLIEQLTHLVR